MPKALILYYSRTGNTRIMAEAIAEAIKTTQGIEVQLRENVTPQELADFDAILVGAPTYHHDMTRNIKKLFEETAEKNINLENKVGAAFGSYGWSAEAPPLVLEIMNNKFRMNTIDPPLLIKYAPDQIGLQKCRQLGKRIAEKLMART
jgi:flavorubredoxin